jgi:predicted nucleic acid-binding protein
MRPAEGTMVARFRTPSRLLPTAPLLISESAEDFQRIRDAFCHEIGPQGIVEQVYVDDIVHLTWEILRLRRCKNLVINIFYQEGLADLIRQLSRQPDEYEEDVEDQANEMAAAWFTDREAKRHVSELLKTHQLDESAIEAAAVNKAAGCLEQLDKLMISAARRREKSLQGIGEYRVIWAQVLRKTSDQIIHNEVRAIEGTMKKPSAA